MHTKIVCLLAMGLTLVIPDLAQAGESSDTRNSWYCDRQPVTDFWEGEIFGSEATGGARLCATPYGVHASMKVEGLTPGNAYTVWWVYIDQPSACADFPLTPETAPIPLPEPVGYATPCGLADFFTVDPSGAFLNPLVVFGRLDGAIANGDLKTRFRGNWRDFEPTSGSQIWLFAFGHGPADVSDKRQLARQLLTPEDPVSGVPHLGIEGRAFGYPSAVAVFRIP